MLTDKARALEEVRESEAALQRVRDGIGARNASDNTDYVRLWANRAAAAALRIVELCRGVKEGERDGGK